MDEPMMTVRIKKEFKSFNAKESSKGYGVLVGSATKRHADGPFEVEAWRAKRLIEAGVAEAVVAMPKHEKAVENRQDAQRR